MIPTIHQGLHIQVLGQHAPAEDTSDAPDFIAALAERNDSLGAPITTISAEAYLAASMVMPIPAVVTGQPMPTAPQTDLMPTTAPLGVTSDDPAQTASVGAAQLSAATASKPDLLLAAGESLPIPDPQKLRDPDPVAAIVPPAHNSAAPASVAAPAQMPPPITSTKALTRQFPAAETNVPAQTGDQPTDKSTAINHLAITRTHNIEATICQLQAFPDQAPKDPTAPQQDLSVQTQDAASLPVSEQHKTSLSPAESAWQTRLQITAPRKALAQPSIPPTEGDSVDRKTWLPPSSLADITRAPQDTDSPKSPASIADAATPQQPVAAAPLQSAMTEPAAMPMIPAAVSDQTMPQPAPDPRNTQPITAHQSVLTQLPSAPLATAIPAQLIHHAAAARTGGVDVLLQPEELGHVKFQIQQHGETVRILLSAERPETLDMLRRHSDQLLQEFRQSGFSQPSLSFGQWGQQQRSPAPQPTLAALSDADIVEASPPTRTPSTAAAASSGPGLNLRL